MENEKKHCGTLLYKTYFLKIGFSKSVLKIWNVQFEDLKWNADDTKRQGATNCSFFLLSEHNFFLL